MSLSSRLAFRKFAYANSIGPKEKDLVTQMETSLQKTSRFPEKLKAMLKILILLILVHLYVCTFLETKMCKFNKANLINTPPIKNNIIHFNIKSHFNIFLYFFIKNLIISLFTSSSYRLYL